MDNSLFRNLENNIRNNYLTQFNELIDSSGLSEVYSFDNLDFFMFSPKQENILKVRINIEEFNEFDELIYSDKVIIESCDFNEFLEISKFLDGEIYIKQFTTLDYKISNPLNYDHRLYIHNRELNKLNSLNFNLKSKRFKISIDKILYKI